MIGITQLSFDDLLPGLKSITHEFQEDQSRHSVLVDGASRFTHSFPFQSKVCCRVPVRNVVLPIKPSFTFAEKLAVKDAQRGASIPIQFLIAAIVCRRCTDHKKVIPPQCVNNNSKKVNEAMPTAECRKTTSIERSS